MRSGAARVSGRWYGNDAIGSGSDSRSRGSWPAMADRIRPQQSAVRAIGPILSIDHAIAIAP